MSGPVPTATSLADIYPPSALAAEAPRWNALLAKFQTEFGRPARFVSRSPGRVNIIGEHIDYSLYSVLPMAITADALIAVATKPAAPDAAAFTIRVRNVQGAKFPPADFDVPFGADVDIDSTKFEWTNYFKSGLRGALGLLYKKRGPDFRPCDMDVLMDGNVPVGGGLSSSAAFVTASALAVMAANGESAVDKKELTELAIVSERAVGVNSGGYVSFGDFFSAAMWPPLSALPSPRIICTRNPP
jgi:galactokinase